MDETLHCARSVPHCTSVRVASIYWPLAPPSPAACRKNLPNSSPGAQRTKVISQEALHVCAASQTVFLNSPFEQHGGLTTVRTHNENGVIRCICRMAAQGAKASDNAHTFWGLSGAICRDGSAAARHTRERAGREGMPGRAPSLRGCVVGV